MVFSYEKQDDTRYYQFYNISLWIVLIIGIFGMIAFLFQLGIDTTLSFISGYIDNFAVINITLGALAVAALIVGWIQVAFTSKLGEEIILLGMWVTPFVVMAVSVYLYLNSQDTNMLGGLLAGLIFLGFVIYFRKQIRLSARLIEVGAEITIKNMSLLIPQLKAFIFTTIITILMLPGFMVILILLSKVTVILAIILAAIYEFMYLFVIAVIRSFADASNISFVNMWYLGKKANNDLASKEISTVKAPIIKFAFLMAFINKFRSSGRNKFSPLTLFKFMDFRNWPNLIFGGRSITSTAADIAAYFGNYTLIIIVVKKTRSIAQAYKESAKATWKSFAANIAGSMGFNLLEGLRQWISGIILIVAGAFYGYSYFGKLIYAVIMAIMFLILGMTPLNAMFKPVVNSYRLLIYHSYFGKTSSKLDKKTKEIIKNAIKK